MNDATWLAVGLGNPGRRYERTRHNAGARAIGRLAESLSCPLRRGRGRALLAETRVNGFRLLLARPTGYMNDSGPAVASLLAWFKLSVENLIIVHDDIDLRSETLRLKRGGGTAGNHGLDSMVEALRTPDFYRVRIGVGRPEGGGDPASWVLKPMASEEADALAVAEGEAAEAVLAIIREGLERAMNRFNTR
ncbi:MAG: aminoacyl-tRNA hydrolase [Actinomycetota bacterium]